MLNKEALIKEGEEKQIFSTSDPDRVIVHYKDNTTAFHGIKRAVLKDKGKYNCAISSVIFGQINKENLPTHFISALNEREQVCRKVTMIPLHIIIRNRLTGTTAELLGVEHGTKIPNTIFELRYNNPSLGEPMINEHHAVALGLASYEEIELIRSLALRLNKVAGAVFKRVGIELVDFKIEFGKTKEGEIVLADEFSPDNCRLWDIATGNLFDKDRFRHDLSDVCASYKEVMERLLKA